MHDEREQRPMRHEVLVPMMWPVVDVLAVY